MKCKGQYKLRYGPLKGSFQDCGGEEWELVWFKALMEEGRPVNMYQCKRCKRIVMATERAPNSDNWV